MLKATFCWRYFSSQIFVVTTKSFKIYFFYHHDSLFHQSDDFLNFLGLIFELIETKSSIEESKLCSPSAIKYFVFNWLKLDLFTSLFFNKGFFCQNQKQIWHLMSQLFQTPNIFHTKISYFTLFEIYNTNVNYQALLNIIVCLKNIELDNKLSNEIKWKCIESRQILFQILKQTHRKKKMKFLVFLLKFIKIFFFNALDCSNSRKWRRRRQER